MSRRTQKVNALVQGEISRLFIRDVADPHLKNLIVTEVTLSPDLRQAKVFYSTGMMDTGIVKPKELKKSIERVSPFLRRKLSENLDMRYVPELQFIEDHHSENVNRLMHLFHEIKPELN